MATDYSILEDDLNQVKTTLKRALHMHGVHRLHKKQGDLAKNFVQRKQIENLTGQLAEIEPTVSTLYCQQFSLKDNEIKGYLIYLLKMKDFFTREVAAKEEMLRQKDSQIKMVSKQLCVLTNEHAKIMKRVPVKSPEFIRLENISNRMNQMYKRISTMRQENNEIMENIIDMRKFQKQFRVFEKSFRRKIFHFEERAQDLLEKAVMTYEEKDEFMIKKRIFEERRAQDIRRTANNQNALDLCVRKTEKNEAFARNQGSLRIDTRISETSEMIEKGVTGLEPSMETTQDLQTAISNAAGEETPEKMEESFRLGGDRTDMMFSYLDELLKDINRLKGEIGEVEEENKLLTKSMSASDRKLRKDIKINRDKAQQGLENANKAATLTQGAKDELNTMLDVVKTLYVKCCPDDAPSLDETPIDESNVTDYLQKMEKQFLEYLMYLEYLRMKEAEKEEKTLVLEAETDEDDDRGDKQLEHKDKIKPRALLGEHDLTLESDFGKKFLDFEELKEMAIEAIAQMQSEGEDESDDTH